MREVKKHVSNHPYGWWTKSKRRGPPTLIDVIIKGTGSSGSDNGLLPGEDRVQRSNEEGGKNIDDLLVYLGKRYLVNYAFLNKV